MEGRESYPLACSALNNVGRAEVLVLRSRMG
jgi:hypothetical protein